MCYIGSSRLPVQLLCLLLLFIMFPFWKCSCCCYFLDFVVFVAVEGVPLVEFMYLVFTRIPGESYRRWLRSLLLCVCDVFRALINSLVYCCCWLVIPLLALIFCCCQWLCCCCWRWCWCCCWWWWWRCCYWINQPKQQRQPSPISTQPSSDTVANLMFSPMTSLETAECFVNTPYYCWQQPFIVYFRAKAAKASASSTI